MVVVEDDERAQRRGDGVELVIEFYTPFSHADGCDQVNRREDHSFINQSINQSIMNQPDHRIRSPLPRSRVELRTARLSRGQAST